VTEELREKRYVVAIGVPVNKPGMPGGILVLSQKLFYLLLEALVLTAAQR